MDEVSLASRGGGGSVSSSSHRHIANGRSALISSGASVSSAFSRSSRRAMKKSSELGVPLTSSMNEDEEEFYNDNGDSSSTAAAAAAPIASTSTAATATTSTFIGEDDPFYMFRGDLTKKILLVDQELNTYTTLVHTTDTATNTHQIKETKKQLKRHIKHAESTLTDLETTVRVVERQRDKFPHIHDGEMDDRKNFVQESKRRINDAKLAMQSEEIKQKLLKDERTLTERRRGGGGGAGGVAGSNSNSSRRNNGVADDLESDNNNTVNSNTNYNGDSEERSETMLMMQQQDETLEDLDLAVTRVGYMAETIHEEIESQNKMLTELEDDLADAEEQLGMVMGKLAKLLKTKSRCQIGLILILSLIVLVLFFLVLYT
jgi:syntaxin 6